MVENGTYDVTLVAARRPALLARTLQSFERGLFRRAEPRSLIVNLDPLWGDESAAAEAERICRGHVRTVELRQPAQASFGAAVKWLWSRPQTEWFLHLEDDWELLRPIDLRRLGREMQAPDVAQISLSRLNRKAWRKGVWLDRFTTSPSFVRASFAARASGLMIADLDPEKQMYDGRNPALADAIGAPFRHRLHGSRFARPFIEDIGRAWRESRRIEKRVVDGQSVWSGPG